jgi:hypothetical protein
MGNASIGTSEPCSSGFNRDDESWDSIQPALFSTSVSIGMSNSNWIIRNATGADLPFIYSTWMKSYRYDSNLAQGCRNTIFFPEYSRVIDYILSQEDTKALVACSPEENEVIFGYLVHQPHILHYAFTKEAFTQFGIAKALLDHAGGATYYTHRTHISKQISDAHPELIYNPFILFKQEKT